MAVIVSSFFIPKLLLSCGTDFLNYCQVVEGNNLAITWKYPTVSDFSIADLS